MANYRKRQSVSKRQWFVEVPEGNGWKICHVTYSEAKCDEYIRIAKAVDSASSTVK